MSENRMSPGEPGHIEGALKDVQSITADWLPLQQLIEGVKLREVRNVIKNQGGLLTEIFRMDWLLDKGAVDQVFQNVLNTRQISGWHTHTKTTDRIFVNLGSMKIVLYDPRENSSTFGMINEFMLGNIRPGLLIVPPGVWHAVQNIDQDKSALINLVDHAYEYESPDHYRLALDTPHIPYKFS